MIEIEFTEEHLDMFFILNPEDQTEYLKEDEDGGYIWDKGPEGAEIFTHQEIVDLVKDPENKEFKFDAIKVKDSIIMEGINKEEWEISIEDE